MQRLKDLYEQALGDLQNRQQELEASVRQVQGLCNEYDEVKKLQEAQVARLAELEGKTRRWLEKVANLRRQCECQELDKYRALEDERQKWEERPG